MIPSNKTTMALNLIATGLLIQPLTTWAAGAGTELSRPTHTKDDTVTVTLPSGQSRTIPRNPTTTLPWQDAIGAPDVLRPTTTRTVDLAEDNSAPPGATFAGYRYAFVLPAGDVLAVTTETPPTFERIASFEEFKAAHYYDVHGARAFVVGEQDVAVSDTVWTLDQALASVYSTDSFCDLTKNDAVFTSRPTACPLTSPMITSDHPTDYRSWQGPYLGGFSGQLADCGGTSVTVGRYALEYRLMPLTMEVNCTRTGGLTYATGGMLGLPIFGTYVRAGLSGPQGTDWAAYLKSANPALSQFALTANTTATGFHGRWNTAQGLYDTQPDYDFNGQTEFDGRNVSAPTSGAFSMPTANLSIESLAIYTGDLDDHVFFCLRTTQDEVVKVAGGYLLRAAGEKATFRGDLNNGWCTLAWDLADGTKTVAFSPAIAFVFHLSVGATGGINLEAPQEAKSRHLPWLSVTDAAVTNGTPEFLESKFVLNDIYLREPDPTPAP